MKFMSFSFAIAAAASTAFGSYALLRGDIEISIVSLALALLFIAMARPGNRVPAREGSGDANSGASTAETSTASEASPKSIPVLMLDAFEDDETESISATLTGLDGPIFVAFNENDGPVHTLVVPNTPTRLLWSGDLRDCA